MKKSISQMSDKELNNEVMRIDKLVGELEGTDDPQLHSAKVLRFALMCQARARGLLTLSHEELETGPAPAPSTDVVVSYDKFKQYQAKRVQCQIQQLPSAS